MFKKELGISVYPEKSDWKTVEQYLITAHKSGFTKLFMSWFQLERNLETLEGHKNLYIKTIKKAKELGFYVVLDINNNQFAFYESLGIDCVRLDAPASPGDVCIYTQETNLDFQVNMSGDSFYLDNILLCDTIIENIYGCHNFYPQVKTGLAWSDFLRWTKKFNNLGIHTSAFVNSLVGKDGPQPFKLEHGVVTVEDLRFLPLRTQVKLMFATKQIDAVYVGNQFASNEELESLSDIDPKKIELDLELNHPLTEIENKILKTSHWRRGDLNETFIRSSNARGQNVSEMKSRNFYKKGDVVLINETNPNYQGELLIILKDVKLKNTHLLGRVKDYDLSLIDFIKASRWFKFRIMN